MGLISSGIEPSLIHGVYIVIERIDYATTMNDDIFREPTTTVQYLAPEEVFAQVHWMKADELKAAPGGDDTLTDGWITMKKSTLSDLPLGGFKKGDRIIEVDGDSFAVDPLYIEDLASKAQYTNFKLMKYFFKRRSELDDK